MVHRGEICLPHMGGRGCTGTTVDCLHSTNIIKVIYQQKSTHQWSSPDRAGAVRGRRGMRGRELPSLQLTRTRVTTPLMQRLFGAQLSLPVMFCPRAARIWIMRKVCSPADVPPRRVAPRADALQGCLLSQRKPGAASPIMRFLITEAA